MLLNNQIFSSSIFCQKEKKNVQFPFYPIAEFLDPVLITLSCGLNEPKWMSAKWKRKEKKAENVINAMCCYVSWHAAALDGSAIDNCNEYALRHNISLFTLVANSKFCFTEKFRRIWWLLFCAAYIDDEIWTVEKKANQLITQDGFCVRFFPTASRIHEYEAQIYSNEIINVMTILYACHLFKLWPYFTETSFRLHKYRNPTNGSR